MAEAFSVINSLSSFSASPSFPASVKRLILNILSSGARPSPIEYLVINKANSIASFTELEVEFDSTKGLIISNAF